MIGYRGSGRVEVRNNGGVNWGDQGSEWWDVGGWKGGKNDTGDWQGNMVGFAVEGRQW